MPKQVFHGSNVSQIKPTSDSNTLNWDPQPILITASTCTINLLKNIAATDDSDFGNKHNYRNCWYGIIVSFFVCDKFPIMSNLS